jgi:hypothetical protein
MFCRSFCLMLQEVLTIGILLQSGRCSRGIKMPFLRPRL